MKSATYSLVLALTACLAQPVLAETPDRPAAPSVAHGKVPAQVTITKRDAFENVVAVEKGDLAKAVSLASQLVPGALSGRHADVKSITITYN